jgi:sialate O-acetylesterase
MKTKYILLVSLFFSICSALYADVTLPAIFGDHMVLQQKSKIKIWGWCNPNEKIRIRNGWNTDIDSAKGTAYGNWMIELKTPKAGGPYSFTIYGNNTVEIKDILIGEIWLCSGQSNMEMSYSWGVTQYDSDVKNATNNKIRFFQVKKMSAPYPQEDLKGEWVACTPEELKTFSLVGYYFGNKLQKNLEVPVGLIQSAWGGTPAEAWTPADVIEKDPVLKTASDSMKEVPWGPVKRGYLYNAMIHPLTDFRIAGAIWYQGEANVGEAEVYHKLFSTMITSWRNAWDKEIPFYFVQIAPFAGYGNNISAALLQEAQTQTTGLPKTGMVVVNDLVSDINDIHPKDKKEVGLRLADYALHEVYDHKMSSYKSPVYRSMQVEQGKVILRFGQAEAGLTSKGSPTDFYISGSDRVFKPAMAKISGSTVIVWHPDINEPMAVRYGFTNSATPNVFSNTGLPVNTFRTDKWNDVNTITIDAKK